MKASRRYEQICFFKPKAVAQPDAPDLPTITETKAPEPQAPVFGGGDVVAPEMGSSKKTGVSSVKVAKPAMNVNTGANLGLPAM